MAVIDQVDFIWSGEINTPTVSVNRTFTNVGSGTRQLFLMLFGSEDPVVTSVTLTGNADPSLIAGTERGVGGSHCEVWAGNVTVTGAPTVTIFFNSVSVARIAFWAIILDDTDLCSQGQNTGPASQPASLNMVASAGDLSLTAITAFAAADFAFSQGEYDQHAGAVSRYALQYSSAANPTHTFSSSGWSDSAMAGVTFRNTAGGVTPTVGAGTLSGVLGIRSTGFRVTPATP
jgi:hypothetical protein